MPIPGACDFRDHEHLAPQARKRGESHDGECTHGEHGGHQGVAAGQPVQSRKQVRAVGFLNGTCGEYQRPHGDHVVHHVHNAGGDGACGIVGTERQHHHDVRHASDHLVGNNASHGVLRKPGETTHQHGDYAEDDNRPRPALIQVKHHHIDAVQGVHRHFGVQPREQTHHRS